MDRNDILLIHGTDYFDMARQILERADLASDIEDRSKKIALKPNLVGATPPEHGATTHPEPIAATIEYLQENGFTDITVMEGSWVAEKTADAYEASGCKAVCEKYGVPFVDLQKDSFHEYDAKGLKLKVCDTPFTMDYIINIPVLKGHCQAALTCALKNYKGLIPNSEKSRYHTLGLHEPIACLNTLLRHDFTLVDNICGDLDFEQGGNPVVMNRIMAFKDPVLCDSFACDCMGYTLNDVPYIRMAEEFGLGSTDIEHANKVYLNEPNEATKNFKATRRAQALSSSIDQRNACSACYAFLIFAIYALNNEGFSMEGLPKICIGQGFRGEQYGKIGVGNCTSGCEISLKGCPPKPEEMYEFLKENWN